MYVRIYVYTYIYIYIHIYTQTHAINLLKSAKKYKCFFFSFQTSQQKTKMTNLEGLAANMSAARSCDRVATESRKSCEEATIMRETSCE